MRNPAVQDVDPGPGNAFGVPLTAVTMDEAVERCIAWCRAGDRRSHLVTTVNAATVAAMRGDPDLRAACTGSDLLLADGVPVVWAARLAGCPVPQRVAGVDLMQRLLERAGHDRLAVFLLGASQDAVSRLAEVCRERYPGLRIAGCQHGYFGADEHDRIIGCIRASRPDLLFIGMPTPFKETWAHKHLHDFCVPVVMGVGGSFDVVAGFVARAPVWMQRSGLEWAWRLGCEPRRLWRRYLFGNSYFILYTLAAIWRRARAPETRRSC